MIIKANTILVFTHGEYSDYSFDGPLHVTRDFDQAEVSSEFRAQWKRPDEWTYRPSESDFIAWLTKEGYVEAIDNVHTWHIGDYGFEPEIQDEPEPRS